MGIVGLVAYMIRSMGWQRWNSLTAGNLPAYWLEKLRQVGEGCGILIQNGGPREWGVPMAQKLLTFWFFLSVS